MDITLNDATCPLLESKTDKPRLDEPPKPAIPVKTFLKGNSTVSITRLDVTKLKPNIVTIVTNAVKPDNMEEVSTQSCTLSDISR